MSEEDNKGSLVNVNVDMKSIGEAGKALIDKVSGAVGTLYKPRAIVKQAEAEAKAQIIAAKAQLEISEVQQRGLERLAIQEGRKQQNIENIVTGSLAHINNEAQPDNIDNDWLAHFFNRCENISDEQMQQLWSRVLAEEANTPERFSKRTLDFIATMSKKEAEDFSQLCQFVVTINEETFLYISNPNSDNYCGSSLRFSDFVHMDAIGLITLSSSSSYQAINLPDQFEVTYFDYAFQLKPTGHKGDGPDNGVLTIGYAVLTATGHELVRICKAEMSPVFLENIKSDWKLNT